MEEEQEQEEGGVVVCISSSQNQRRPGAFHDEVMGWTRSGGKQEKKTDVTP